MNSKTWILNAMDTNYYSGSAAKEEEEKQQRYTSSWPTFTTTATRKNCNHRLDSHRPHFSYRKLAFVLLVILFAKSNGQELSESATDHQDDRIFEELSEPNRNREENNIFENGGCLANMLPGWTKKRVCHSGDTEYAIQNGYCDSDKNKWDYMEIRIHSQNWESAFFHAWILQIVLSEILQVPTTIETGSATAHLDFYQPTSGLEYGTAYDWVGLRQADVIGDCRLLQQTEGKYQSCSHIVPEVWEGQLFNMIAMESDGIIEAPQGIGALGEMGWFIPRFTAERDPTLVGYLGMAGEENREKLAKTFLRPTTWGDYCDLVSQNNCRTPDNVTVRAPENAEEASKFYVNEVFTGFFRPTERNDCQKYPKNCTGHIVDLPCGWSSFVQQQTYHLNIALESSGTERNSHGYSYSEITQIWAASNHTKSDLVMMWWNPDALFQDSLRTDAEFQRVNLPPPTQECIDARVNPFERCSDEFEGIMKAAVGGACQEPPHVLKRVIGKSLYRMIHDPSIPIAARSPAYETIKAFTLSGLQLGKIFDYWLKPDDDSEYYDAREATCRWVVENFHDIQSIIPQTYPRVLKDKRYTDDPIFYVSVCIAVLSLIAVVFSMFGTKILAKKPSVSMAQVEFLWLLLVGMLMVSFGAIVLGIQPTALSCTAVVWLVNLGYTLELVPLIVKVAAINKLSTSARRFRRVVLRRVDLFGVVIVLSSVVVCFLVLWTILDHPYQQADYQLSDTKTQDGETIVYEAYSCQSNSSIWKYTSLSWHALLLVTATVQAFQMRHIQHTVNESSVLATLIYSHFVFVVLRFVSFYLEDFLQVTDFAMSQSLIFSADVLATCFIYFFPKFLRRNEEFPQASTRISGGTHFVRPELSQNSFTAPQVNRSNNSRDADHLSVRVVHLAAQGTVATTSADCTINAVCDDKGSEGGHVHASSWNERNEVTSFASSNADSVISCSGGQLERQESQHSHDE